MGAFLRRVVLSERIWRKCSIYYSFKSTTTNENRWTTLTWPFWITKFLFLFLCVYVFWRTKISVKRFCVFCLLLQLIMQKARFIGPTPPRRVMTLIHSYTMAFLRLHNSDSSPSGDSEPLLSGNTQLMPSEILWHSNDKDWWLKHIYWISATVSRSCQAVSIIQIWVPAPHWEPR